MSKKESWDKITGRNDYFKGLEKFTSKIWGGWIETGFHCILCGYEDRHRMLMDYYKDNVTIVECGRCGHIQLYPYLQSQIMEKFYAKSSSNDKWLSIQRNDFEVKYMFGMNEDRFKIIDDNFYSKNKRMLDVGCCSGITMMVAEEHKYKVKGIELNKSAKDLKDVFGKRKIIIGDFLSHHFGRQKFGLITAYGILEHMNDVVAFVKKARELLDKDGILVIVVPNFCSYSNRILKANGPTFNITHLSYFTEKTLKKLARRTHYQIMHFSTELPLIDKVLQQIKFKNVDLVEKRILERNQGYRIFTIWRKNGYLCK